MNKRHTLKKLKEAVHDSDQSHRILHEMDLPEGTEFTTDDSDGVVTIRINKINYEKH